MKFKKAHIICLLLFAVAILGFSQQSNVEGYRIEGDEVVFTFDKRDYQKGTSFDGYSLDFQDIDISSVVLAGEFNQWSRDDWRMNRVDENTFELRKKMHDFDGKFTWEFKFVVNNFYWAEPDGEALNSVPATNEYGVDFGVYNLTMHYAYPDSKGNLTFTLDGYTDANEVVLSGTFNLWNEKAFKMQKTENGWKLSLNIRPGVYEYKFIVDKEWIHDPLNPIMIQNEHGTYNSIVDIRSEETFYLNGYLEAKKVILSGSFNNWSEADCSMDKTEKGWKYTTILSGGKHHYKFIVDGEWICDPDNPILEYDYDGNVNSVYMVK